MTEAIPDLWPEEATSAPVLSPQAILGLQAFQLEKRTGGRLKAALIEVPPAGEQHNHRIDFELIAPYLDGYRYKLFTVHHAANAVYPATFESPNLHPRSDLARANTPDEFLQVLAQELNSKSTKATISALLARTDDAMRNGAARLPEPAGSPTK